MAIEIRRDPFKFKGVGPLEALVPPAFVELLRREAKIDDTGRRVLTYIYADALRGTGRLPNALRDEGRHLAGPLEEAHPLPQCRRVPAWRRFVRVVRARQGSATRRRRRGPFRRSVSTMPRPPTR